MADLAAATQVEDVRRAYYETLGGEQQWWWIRAMYVDPPELIVDDDEGSLYRVPFTVSGKTVEFGDAKEVTIQYVNAAAGQEEQHQPAIVYASRADSRPTQKEDDLDPKEIREALGLAEDASDEDVMTALRAKAIVTPDPDPAAPDPAEPPAPQDPEPVTPEGEQVLVTAGSKPGTVTVDAAAWQEMQATTRELAAGRAADQASADDRTLEDAIKAGKFPRSRKEHYQKSLAADRQGTLELVASLAENLVPVKERGSSPSEESMDSQAYDPAWLSQEERSRIAAASAGEPPQRRVTVGV